MKRLEDTELFKRFKEVATPEQIVLVTTNAKKAADRLMLVRDTFPTYTLHNEQHILNVIELMGKLLGNEIDLLTPLEMAILILSAYYHDIGMVFTSDERESIQHEIEFDEFIRKYPKAHLKILEFQKENPTNNNQIPEDVAEWYCRWIHPDRSASYVLKLNKLKWGNYPINDSIAAVCRSHGYSIGEVSTWKSIKTDLLCEADLLFCSILLRLADILDFDNSRSPEEVYDYLGLSKRKTKEDEISDREWLKHLNSDGFKFSFDEKDKKNDTYTIKFAAAPEESTIEFDIREFLNIIESEFNKCNAILKTSPSRWKNFYLPLTIDRSDIISKGYTYGEYRFTLQQDQILNLLMGENLYSDSYVFVRELAQNAIDTTRHRQIYEKSRGYVNFVPEPIVFSTWQDSDGYTWVRIDDYGMGMDEEIITNYFLKVGQSYYQSEQFKVDQMSLKSDFMPISRFGIGILSCFIVGDQIELSTRKVTEKPGRNAIRMTMSGLNSFFVLKKELEQHPCHNMPNQNKLNETYRKKNDFGTSIAIRLNSKKERADFDLKKILNRYIVVSPIQIKLNEEIIGGDYNKVIENEWCEYTEYPIDEFMQSDIENALDFKFSEPLKIVVRPLNLTENSSNKNFKGQAIIGYVKYPSQDIDNFFNSSYAIRRDIELRRDYFEGIFSIAIYYENSDILKELKERYGYEEDREYYNSIHNKLRGTVNRIQRERGNIIADSIYSKINSIMEGEKIHSLEDIIQEINIFSSKKEVINKAKEFKRLIDKSKLTDKEEFELFCENIDLLFKNYKSNSLYYYVHAIERKDFVTAMQLWNNFINSIPDLNNVDSLIQEIQSIYNDAIKYVKIRDEFKKAKIKLSFKLEELSAIFNDKFKQINLHWLSHNGIYVPTQGKNNLKFEINVPIKGSFINYNLALMDSLRPDLSISRDELRGFNWNIYSTINYSFSKTLSSLELPAKMVNPDVFSRIYDTSNFLMGHIINDPLIKSNKYWALEKIFETNNQLFSLVDLRESFTRNKNISLSVPIDVNKTYDYNKNYLSNLPSYLQYCKAALIQIGLNVELDNKSRKLIIIDNKIPYVNGNYKYYPPLFFVKYNDEKILRIVNNPINSSHPFSKWLIKNTENLYAKYPGILERIRISISKGIYNRTVIKIIISEINSILKRLEDLNYEDKPSKSIYLKEEDFVYVI